MKTISKKPDWNTYFMAIATVVSQRSIDPSTKVGCVVVNSENSILTTGYNGPPRGMIDESVPLERPEKYHYMSHAEINAIANAARHGVCLRGSTFFITTPPCDVCFRSIINSGAKAVVFGHVPTHEKDRYNFNVTEKMSRQCNVNLIPYEKLVGNKNDVLTFLESSIEYIKNKL